jgi:hypothetical protein
VTDSTFDSVDIVSKGQSGVDAESDLSGIGMGHVTFTNCTIPGLVIIETLTGPVTFGDDTLTGRVQFRAVRQQAYGITFDGGTLAAGLKANPPIIWQSGTGPNASLTFDGTLITRPNGGQAPLWVANNHAVLVFENNGVLPPPLGSNDPTSSVSLP